jgi:hypothetical protein
VGWKILLIRALLVFTVVNISVYMTELSQTAAGMASSFPSITIVTMITVWYSQGQSVITGAAGPMMLGGVSVAIYAM